MFTPGFRLFMGFAGVALVAAFAYGVVSGNGDQDYLGFLDASAWIGAASLGWKGGVGDHVGYIVLVMTGVAAGGLAVMLVAFRDADPEAVAELNDGQLPPAQGTTVTSYWPVVGAFGAGLTVIGLALHAALFAAGLLVLAAVAFEWMMSAWADRATGDPVANHELRNRIMKPIEVPVLGAIGIGVLVLASSRVFLTVSKPWAVWIAVIASAVVFLGAVALALAEKPSRNVVAGVLTLGALGTIAAGVVSAAIGEREIVHHGDHADDHGDADHEDEGALGW